MDRFPRRQFTARSPGPPASAAADGLAQGMAYTAVVRSIVVNGECAVTIPAIHLTEPFTAHVGPGLSVTEGETVMVVCDEQKRPWIVVGGAMSELSTLEAELDAAEVKIESLEASRTSDEAKIAALEPKAIKVSGTQQITWTASATATATITHGLGKTPSWFSLALQLSGQVAYLQATAVGSTTISVNGQAPASFSGEGKIYWAAF